MPSAGSNHRAGRRRPRAATSISGASQARTTPLSHHGGTLRVLDAYLHGVPVEQMRWDLLGNASVLKEKLT